jgi:hypothetical protein
MTDFFRSRSRSLSMVVLVLVGILLLQGQISYSTAFGSLDRFIQIPGWQHGGVPTAWLVLRVASLVAVAFSIREDAPCCRTARVEKGPTTCRPMVGDVT